MQMDNIVPLDYDHFIYSQTIGRKHCFSYTTYGRAVHIDYITVESTLYSDLLQDRLYNLRLS